MAQVNFHIICYEGTPPIGTNRVVVWWHFLNRTWSSNFDIQTNDDLYGFVAYTSVTNTPLSLISDEDITLFVNFVLKLYNNIDQTLLDEMTFLCDQDVLMSVSGSDTASLILLGRLGYSEKYQRFVFWYSCWRMTIGNITVWWYKSYIQMVMTVIVFFYWSLR